MAVPKVSVEIEYAPQENNISSVNFGNTFDRVSGVQDDTYPNTLSTISSGANPFVLGKSILGTGAVYMSEYDGYYSSMASGSDLYDATDPNLGYKISENGLPITISRNDGQPITQLMLFFDNVVKQYPIVISINGTQYINDGGQFVWADMASTASSITITLLSWNTQLSAIKLTGIIDGLTLKYNKGNGLDTVSLTMQSTESETAEYGCISKTDSVSLIDYNYEIQNLSDRGFITPNIKIKILVNDKEYNYTTNSDWFVSDKNITIEVVDEIYNWSDIDFTFTEDIIYANNGSNILDLIKNAFNSVGISSDRLYFTEATEIYLESIIFDRWFPQTQTNFRQFLDDVCVLTQCYIYMADGDKIIISRG